MRVNNFKYGLNLEALSKAQEGSFLHRLTQHVAFCIHLARNSSPGDNWYEAQRRIAVQASNCYDGQAYLLKSQELPNRIMGKAERWRRVHGGTITDCTETVLHQFATEIAVNHNYAYAEKTDCS